MWFTRVAEPNAAVRTTGASDAYRLFVQIQRILEINHLQTITAEVVEAARETLVIGSP